MDPTFQKFQISDPFLGTDPGLEPSVVKNVMIICEKQCFASGSGVDPNSMRSADPDQNRNLDSDKGRQK
jgi:hypothetical protein